MGLLEFIKKIFTQDVDFSGENYLIPGIDDSEFFSKGQEMTENKFLGESKFPHKETVKIQEKEKKPDVNRSKWHQL